MPEDLHIKSTLSVYENIDELPEELQALVTEAQESAMHAYAPYSNFRVGAAVVTEDKEIIAGSNQENAAYPSGLCAERVALFYSSATHPDARIKAIAVVANKKGEWVPAMPCGSCRQVIREYETKQSEPIKIVMAYKDGKFLIAEGAEDLLPLSFTKTDL